MTLKYAEQTAIITELGATLRSYYVGKRPVVLSFDPLEVCPHSQGQILAPWPNRLRDGKYSFDGEEIEVPVNEKKNNNAIHGFFCWQKFRIDSVTENSCLLTLDSLPLPWYPYHVLFQVEYMLSQNGLSVKSYVKNEGDKRLPFALGFHPYLVSGEYSIDDCKLTIPAKKRLLTDSRQIPVDEIDVGDTDYDFSNAAKSRYIEGLVLDDCFFDLESAEEGQWSAVLESPMGEKTILWADSVFGYIMCYTADHIGINSRRAIAIEPMTAPPNALATGKGLIILNPQSSWQANYGINPCIN